MPIPSTLTNIPKVQTNDRNINQLQQNLIDGVSRIQGQIFQSSSVIGESRTAFLTSDQFIQQAGPGWVVQDGSSCIGSAYTKLTGNRNVPVATPPAGALTFIRIN